MIRKEGDNMNQKKYYLTAFALYLTYFILGIAVTIMGQYKQNFAAMWGAQQLADGSFDVSKVMALFDKNILPIGFMGAGKSTVSACLKEMLAMEIMEMDAHIQAKEGMTITEIFKCHGEEYFRNCESNTLIQLQGIKQTVVSCGGGVALRSKNVELMKKCGYVVWLTAAPESIYDRVKDSTERPLLNGNMNIPYIQNLMESRQEKYIKAADIMIDTTDREITEICEELIQKLSAFQKNNSVEQSGSVK